MKRLGAAAVIGIVVALAWSFVLTKRLTKRQEQLARDAFNARCTLITAGKVVSLYECDSVKVWIAPAP